MTTDIPEEIAQNKAAWLEDCAACFIKAGCAEDVAQEFAIGCWDFAIEDYGDEQVVLEHVLPEEAAAVEMEYWDGD